MYHMEKGEWEKVIFSEPYGYECVNGTLRRKFVGWCDVVMCGRQAVNKQMEYEWDMKVFREGEKKVCGNQTYFSYEKTDAPKGMYKVRYGMAETMFSIQ